MPSDFLVFNSRASFQGHLTVPGSKSITNRTLLLSTLSHGTTHLKNVPKNDDVNYMLQALSQLGVQMKQHAENLKIEGVGGNFPCQQAELFLGNAGTATRFLTAGLCVSEGSFKIDGVERMRERPIAPLVETLKQLGAEISYQKKRAVFLSKSRQTGSREGWFLLILP